MKKKTVRDKIDSFTYNHIWLRYALDWGTAFIMSVLSAFIFAFGIATFMNPGAITVGGESFKLISIVSGGASGTSQTIASFLELFNVRMPDGWPTFYSIFYLIINIPLIVLAFKGIGARFATFTLVNVACVFLFSTLFTSIVPVREFLATIGAFFNEHGGLFSRAFFAGICTGLSSAIAYKYETSAGGFDIVSYYLGLRKNTSVGKFGVIINGIIILAYSIIHAFSGESYTLHLTATQTIEVNSVQMAVILSFFAIIYLVTVMIIVDLINIRNKKVQVQIITDHPDMAKLLIANIPHGATIINGKGAYSGNDRFIVYMIVSSNEVKNVIKIVKEIDDKSFVIVTPINQVYGRFFMRPVK